MARDPMPTVFTLLPALRREQWLERSSLRPLVFQRQADGRVTIRDFPDEIDVCEPIVGELDPNLVRLQRERLYINAANGEAVYVPVGPSPIPGCRRFGRIYRRP